MISFDQDLSAQVAVPILSPNHLTNVSFNKSFHIPDSLHKRQLNIWFLGLQGISTIKLNNIPILDRFNLVTPFKIAIPGNLLNISGENNLEIVLRKAQSPDDGIPDQVKLFNHSRNLGITGEIYLEWFPSVYYSDIAYNFENKNLSFSYQFNISEIPTLNRGVNPKIRCEEEIIDPQGNIVFKRFEYIDYIKTDKKFQRKVEITHPATWSHRSPSVYHLVLRARTGSGRIAFQEQIIGLKETNINRGDYYINDSLVTIKGINYRLEYPLYNRNQATTFSQSDFYKQIRTDLTDIKQLGFNAVRFPDGQPHPFCFQIADSLGLYLFVENGLWRIPEPYFRGDNLLQASKQIADDIINIHSLHPSLTALGIGCEIPIHLPAVKKFILILKGYINQKSSLPVYLVPLNANLLSQKLLTDFYILNKYDISLLRDFSKIKSMDFLGQGTKIYFGNVGFALPAEREDRESRETQILQSAYMQMFFKLTANTSQIGGYFLESYRDWETKTVARLSINNSPGQSIYPYGLIDSEGKKRDLHGRIKGFLDNHYPLPEVNPIVKKKSNFFSISVFIFSILVLFIYQQNYRFRENMKRSMAHPYGFFIDLRDRRIISILNSTLAGLYTNFLVTTIISAYLYYMRDNLYLEEHISSVLGPLNLKFFYLTLIDSPLLLSLFIWFCFYIMQLTVVIFLKMINLLAAEKIRFRQYLAICNWSGAPLMLLLPLSLLSFHLMRYEIFHQIIIIVLAIFFFWYNFRLGNGLRVLQSIRGYKIFIIMILIYGGMLLTFGTIFELDDGLITYFRLLTDAGPLF